jgi:outer membrane protein assembly factor BamB
MLSPVVVDGTVFVGSYDHHVYALDASTSRERWRVETDGLVISSPAVADGTVFVGSYDHVYAFTETRS